MSIDYTDPPKLQRYLPSMNRIDEPQQSLMLPNIYNNEYPENLRNSFQNAGKSSVINQHPYAKIISPEGNPMRNFRRFRKLKNPLLPNHVSARSFMGPETDEEQEDDMEQLSKFADKILSGRLDSRNKKPEFVNRMSHQS